MTAPNTLRQELAAGFHSSVREADRSGVSMSDLGFYARRLNEVYGYIKVRSDIESDDFDQRPILRATDTDRENPDNDEAVAAQLMALDDKELCIAAEVDARRAAVEVDRSINEIDRIIGIVSVGQSASVNEQGDR